MKFIKRLFAKKYTVEEINERLALVNEQNMMRLNALTEKHLTESAQIYKDFVKKSNQLIKDINKKFEESSKKPDAPVDYQAMVDRIKAQLPEKLAEVREQLAKHARA